MFAGGKQCTAGDVERELDRELDGVDRSGVLPNRLNERGVVGRSNRVAAVAAESLASEHVAPDTESRRLEAR